ncbi:hypothetical protein T11_15737 [Trichinella zimbabwensis]|uniref:Uncharacterized protein n=1 Tax=Trichinella zimbabwensis TaxID=268475 RepID=A0A0V1HW50_9BILA|nr:hypothetical protein T11_15737 [Trichinella zimbabwensis]
MRANGLTMLKQSLEKRQATKRNKLGARGNERCVSLIATVNHFHFHVFHLLLEQIFLIKTSLYHIFLINSNGYLDNLGALEIQIIQIYSSLIDARLETMIQVHFLLHSIVIKVYSKI